jgi:hypothetical protein
VKRSRNVIWILLIVAIDLSCKRNSELSRIRAGDFSIVCKDTYHGRLKFLGSGREYDKLVEGLRAEIEKDAMVILDIISDRFYTIPHKEYKFKFAAFDETSDCLVLRYFARIVEHPVYAGYQIQFVFSRTPRKLLKVFSSEVPLE